MKVSNNTHVTEQLTSETSGRRKFLIRTSAGVVIATLPAKSVWGACNASGTSGGSRSGTSDCYIPVLSGGRSPGSWGKFVGSGSPDNNDRNKVRDLFNLHGYTTSQLNTAFCNVRSFIRNMSPVVLSPLGSAAGLVELDIESALLANGEPSNLASFYLNAYFGFYGSLSPFADANELIQHVWMTLFIQNGNSIPTSYSGIQSSFTNGSTHASNLPGGLGC